MSSITSIAITEAPVNLQDLVWALSNTQSLEEKYKAAMSTVRQIRSRYAGENDDLSKDLKDWIDRLSTFVEREKPTTFDELARLARREFDLLQEMFRNPLDPDRFVETVFYDGKYIWDEKTLKDYPSHISPFDCVSRIEVYPHPFCGEMIAWWKSLPLDPLYQMTLRNPQQLILRNFAPAPSSLQQISSQNTRTKLELYLLNAEQAVSKKKILNQQKDIGKLVVAIRTTIPRAKQEVGEVVGLMNRSIETHHTESNMRLTALEETQATARNIFNATIQNRDQQISQLNHRQTQSEAEIRELKRQEANFQSQIASQASTIAALSNQVHSRNDGGGCAIL
jgi:hypothetical protein